MFSLVYSKKIAIMVLIFFCWFTFSYAYTAGSQDDTLEKKVLKYFYEGNYEGAIEMLNEYIKQIKNIKKKKMELAEAYYHLAKTFYKVGLDDEVLVNLKEVYKSYHKFDKEELDADFLKLAKNAQKDVLLEMEQARSEVKSKKEKVKTEAEEKTEIKKEKDKKTEKKPEIKKKITPIASGIKIKEGEKKKKKFPILLVVLGAVVVGILVMLLSKGESEEDNIGIEILRPADGAVVGDKVVIEGKAWANAGIRDIDIWVISEGGFEYVRGTFGVPQGLNEFHDTIELNIAGDYEHCNSDSLRLKLVVSDMNGKKAESNIVLVHRY